MMLDIEFRRPHMILKTTIARKIFVAAACAGQLMWAGASVAAEPQAGEYKASEFLSLDLPAAVLSPKPLGPPAQFAPVRIEDASGDPAQQARAEPKSVPDKVVAERAVADQAVPDKAVARPHIRTAKVVPRVEKPRGAARVNLAKRHTNPLDAQAFDTRVQVWPCKTGGICNWQRQ
jgi:hypothetical protein